VTLIAFALAVILLPSFVIIESRSGDPMLSLRLFTDRNRTGSYLDMLFVSFGPMGTFYLLTLNMQHILEYDSVRTGLAWLLVHEGKLGNDDSPAWHARLPNQQDVYNNRGPAIQRTLALCRGVGEAERFLTGSRVRTSGTAGPVRVRRCSGRTAGGGCRG
jgi:hypothetical protein